MGEGRRTVFGLLLMLIEHMAARGVAHSWGRIIYGNEVVRAVGTAHTASWFSEVEDAVCKPEYSLNRTLQPIIEAVSKCPNPYHQLREVNPEHIIWTRVHKKKAPKPVDRTARCPRVVKKRADVLQPRQGRDGDGSAIDSSAHQPRASGYAEEGALVGQPGQLMAFLLVLPGDYFCDQLVALTSALVPAFPHVVWLKGDGQVFSSLASQMSLRSFPQLLLFENGIFKTRYSGRRRLSSLIEWMVENTATLPLTRVHAAEVYRLPSQPDWRFYLSFMIVIVQMLVWITGGRCSKQVASASRSDSAIIEGVGAVAVP